MYEPYKKVPPRRVPVSQVAAPTQIESKPGLWVVAGLRVLAFIQLFGFLALIILINNTFSGNFYFVQNWEGVSILAVLFVAGVSFLFTMAFSYIVECLIVMAYKD